MGHSIARGQLNRLNKYYNAWENPYQETPEAVNILDFRWETQSEQMALTDRRNVYLLKKQSQQARVSGKQ